MLKDKKSNLILLTGLIGYLFGCFLWYFLWYKNSQFLNISIITLVFGGCFTFILQYKGRAAIFKKHRSFKVPFVILFIMIFLGGAATADHFARTRVNDILNNEPKGQAIAAVVSIDMRSTRTGKQPWAIINYTVKGKSIEQSFPVDANVLVGTKYLVVHSVKYPDMFRILKELP